MLSDRRQRVLAALIEEYVARAIPVGSRTLTERYGLGVSPATIRNELSMLEDETVLLQILDSTAQSDGTPRVKIGSENEAEQLSGVSVVASRFGSGEGEGIVAVIGPTRMDYSKVLQAVRMASRTLSDD